MKIKKLIVKNYRSLKDVTINFEDLTIIVGKNDSGKSNILKALDMFFNWTESEQLKEISDGGRGSYFDYVLTLRDFRIFFEQKPQGIDFIGHLELTEDELMKLFPGDTIEFWDSGITKNLVRRDLGNKIEVSSSILPKNNDLNLLINYIKVSDLYLYQKTDIISPRQLTRRGNHYEYGGPGEVVVTNFLNMLRKKFLIIPAVRSIKSEGRTTNRPNLDGTFIPTNYLRYEKDVSLRKEDVFRQIKDDVSNLFPHYKTIVSMEDGRGFVDLYFDSFPSSNVGDGVKQQFVNIFDLNSYTDIIFGMEEPEIHLHPESQRKVYDYLKGQCKTKQIIVTTHSPAFASAPELKNLRLVKISDSTSLSEVTEDNVFEVIRELGVKPSDIFDDDVIVFVEGVSDVQIFNTFTKKLKPDSKIGFIDSGGWNSMGYYANARVLKYRKIKVPIYVIFDGDTQTNVGISSIKSRLVSDLPLEQDHLITLTKNSIEDYLLIPRAIKSAFQNLNMSEVDIKDFIDHSTETNKKLVLDKLFRMGGLPSYKESFGVNISQAMTIDEIDAELKEIINKLCIII